MLHLLDTTLVCADCRDRDSALSAMSICLNQVDFDDVIFFTDKKCSIYPGQVIKIPPLSTIQAYSEFMFRDLHNYIKTKYILICQYDGFIINPSSWDNKFYDYDYIGAPWWHHRGQVGNGGFSFRTLKLHKIISDPRFDKSHPEDSMICRRYREVLEKEHKIKFAPQNLAEKFSLESSVGDMINRKPFGFHGKHCVNQAKKIARNPKNFQIAPSIKCYLRPMKHIPLL